MDAVARIVFSTVKNKNFVKKVLIVYVRMVQQRLSQRKLSQKKKF